jgi:hypothetical protein
VSGGWISFSRGNWAHAHGADTFHYSKVPQGVGYQNLGELRLISRERSVADLGFEPSSLYVLLSGSS